MLKLFRKYNKFILAIGASILMVAFLVQSTLSMWMPSGLSTAVGTILSGAKTITVGDRQTAQVQIDTLGKIGLGNYPPLGQTGPDEALRFYLMTYEAQQLGLWATDSEVSEVEQTLHLNRAALAELNQRYHVRPAAVHQAIRHWLMVEAYRELAAGNAFTNLGVGASSPGLRMLDLTQMLAQMKSRSFQLIQIYRMLLQGGGRVSKPLVAHYLMQQSAQVSGHMMVVGSGAYLKKVAAPSDAQVKKLYQQYKGDLAGTSKPYGFGYRIPNRVKLDYLVVPMAAVRKTIEIPELKVMRYYRDHHDQFTETATAPASSQPTTKVKPYNAVRSEIRDQIKQQEAQQRSEQMVKLARSLMLNALKQAGTKDGYRQLPPHFQRMSMKAVAAQVAQRFGVKPEVFEDTHQWVPVAKINDLPVLGDAELGTGENAYSAAEYIASARELKPSNDNPLVARRLQVDVPSDPMSTGDAEVVFRLTAAEPTREPKNLAEVRRQVEHDARMLEAYHQVQAERGSLVQLAKTKGLEAAAASVGVSTLPFKNLRRREPDMYGHMVAPSLPVLGANTKVIDAFFDTASGAAVKHGGTQGFDKLPLAERTGSAAVPSRLSVAIYTITGYDVITRQQFEQEASRPLVSVAASQFVRRTANNDPLSLESLEARLHFVKSKG